MAYKSGWCGNGNHSRCNVIVRNGNLAMQRYALCTCQCHDGSEEAFAIVVGGLGAWDVPKPETPSMFDLVAFVDAVNRKARPDSLYLVEDLDDD